MAKTKCPAKYKNLGLETFSEKKKVTDEMLRQFCKNDEWLRQRIFKLTYLTPPAVRKWWQIGKTIKKSGSWGYGIYNDNVQFSNETQKDIVIPFTDEGIEKYVNVSRSTSSKVHGVVFETLPDADREEVLYAYERNVNGDIIPILNGNGEIVADTVFEDDDLNDVITSSPTHSVVLPTITEKKLVQKAKYNKNTANTWMNGQINAYWYIGFNKAKNYYVRPDWLADYKDTEIPSVCRGQTFTATVSGKLMSVDFRLKFTGDGTSNTGSPLYVEIWKVKNRKVKKTVWDENEHYQKYVYRKSWSDNTTTTDVNQAVTDAKGNPVHVMEKIAWIDSASSRRNPLAKAEYHPDKTTGGWTTVSFDKPCKITQGHKYAIVMMSPLSEYANCPTWGGWGRNCDRDKKYPYGHAFYSENNGRTWHLYGKNDPDVPDYHSGKYVPQDFSFKCSIMTQDKEYADDVSYATGDHYLYLKPIFTNPITHINIEADDNRAETGVNITYEGSVTGKLYDNSWFEIPTIGEIKLVKPSKKLFIRAKISRDSELDGNDNDIYAKVTPRIRGMEIHLKTLLPNEMYVRTEFYAPKTSPMLGANVWGRVFAEIEENENTECRMEIIQKTEMSDHFTLVELDDVDEAMREVGIDTSDILNMDIYDRAIYFTSHRDILDEMKKSNIYVLPIRFVKNQGDLYETLFRLSFTPSDEEMEIPYYGVNHKVKFSGLKFTNKCASPILKVKLDSKTNTQTTFSEWSDFDFDYVNDELIFHDYAFFNFSNNPNNERYCLSGGDLEVTYNNVFIDNLTPEEVGWHVDEESGMEEDGLVLDYFKETFLINNTHLETRRVPLRAKPTDPIREVVLNRDTDDERTLVEEIDFTLDTDTNELVFPVTRETDVSRTILNYYDMLEVVYTPFLTDDQIALGFHATRTDTNQQISIGRYYYEYKA